MSVPDVRAYMGQRQQQAMFSATFVVCAYVTRGKRGKGFPGSAMGGSGALNLNTVCPLPSARFPTVTLHAHSPMVLCACSEVRQKANHVPVDLNIRPREFPEYTSTAAGHSHR